MDKKYYIPENGKLIGPFSPEELRERGLRSDTRVYVEGGRFLDAKDYPELADYIYDGPTEAELAEQAKAEAERIRVEEEKAKAEAEREQNKEEMAGLMQGLADLRRELAELRRENKELRAGNTTNPSKPGPPPLPTVTPTATSQPIIEAPQESMNDSMASESNEETPEISASGNDVMPPIPVFPDSNDNESLVEPADDVLPPEQPVPPMIEPSPTVSDVYIPQEKKSNKTIIIVIIVSIIFIAIVVGVIALFSSIASSSSDSYYDYDAASYEYTEPYYDDGYSTDDYSTDEYSTDEYYY